MSQETILTPQELGKSSYEIHPGGAKRLNAEIQAFVLTMQHAIRPSLHRDLKKIQDDTPEMFKQEEFTLLDVFDYQRETDIGFYNWLFPCCPYILTAENLSAIQVTLVENIRRNLSNTNAEQ